MRLQPGPGLRGGVQRLRVGRFSPASIPAARDGENVRNTAAATRLCRQRMTFRLHFETRGSKLPAAGSTGRAFASAITGPERTGPPDFPGTPSECPSRVVARRAREERTAGILLQGMFSTVNGRTAAQQGQDFLPKRYQRKTKMNEGDPTSSPYHPSGMTGNHLIFWGPTNREHPRNARSLPPFRH